MANCKSCCDEIGPWALGPAADAPPRFDLPPRLTKKEFMKCVTLSRLAEFGHPLGMLHDSADCKCCFGSPTQAKDKGKALAIATLIAQVVPRTVGNAIATRLAVYEGKGKCKEGNDKDKDKGNAKDKGNDKGKGNGKSNGRSLFVGRAADAPRRLAKAWLSSSSQQ